MMQSKVKRRMNTLGLTVEAIGQHIAECRQLRGMSRSELARRSSVDDGSLSCIERGLNLPGIRTLLPIFAVLYGPHAIVSDTKEPGCRIHLLRNNFLLTQTQIGALIGVDNVRISRWEHGTALPSLAALRRLCRVFALDLNFFCGQMAQAS